MSFLDDPIDQLELSVRSISYLKSAGVNTVRELLSKSEGDLLQMPNIGRKTLTGIKQGLSLHGCELGVIPSE